MHNDYQRLCDIIAILVEKIGGNVTITTAEMEDPPIATQTTDHINNQLIFTTERELKHGR